MRICSLLIVRHGLLVPRWWFGSHRLLAALGRRRAPLLPAALGDTDGKRNEQNERSQGTEEATNDHTGRHRRCCGWNRRRRSSSGVTLAASRRLLDLAFARVER